MVRSGLKAGLLFEALRGGLHTTALTICTRAYGYKKLFNKLMVSLGYAEYVTQGGDWGHVVRFCALLNVVDETELLLLVDAGIGIPVWSPARQGLTYQFTSVGWLRLLMVSSFLTHHQYAQRRPDLIQEKPNSICQTPHHTLYAARTGRYGTLRRISGPRQWVFPNAIDSSADPGIWSRRLARRDAGMDI